MIIKKSEDNNMFGSIKKTVRAAICAVCAAAIAVSALACYSSEPEKDTLVVPKGQNTEETRKPSSPSAKPQEAEKLTEAPIESGEPTRKGEGWTAEFFRIGFSSDASKRAPVVIKNAEELKKAVNISSKSKSSDNTMAEFTAACDEEFFKTHHIVSFCLTFSSGSIQPSVSGVEVKDGKLVISVGGTMQGDVGTDDMATHLGMLVLDSSRFDSSLPIDLGGAGYYGAGEVR